MQPDNSRPTAPIVVPPRQSGLNPGVRPTGSEEAANLVRNQINNIYDSDPNLTSREEAIQAGQESESVNIQYTHQNTDVANPYQRTHDDSQPTIQEGAWQKYHSAWQSYYQQYYERYYVGQVHEAKKSLEEQVAERDKHQSHSATDAISSDEALYDLRAKLRNSVRERAQKVRKSRHFIPVVAATIVMIIFLSLQYNRVIGAYVFAYITPGNIDPTNISADPASLAAVGPETKVIIPKINVDAPIVMDAIASSQDSLNAAMEKGTVWFNIPGANARPGQKGNFVVSGHSSNDWLDNGEFKFIFAPLENMAKGDTVNVNYGGKRYTYEVFDTKVVKPTDVGSLQIGNDKPYLTLITCTPLGTALNRLLVFAEQVSPDPSIAESAPTSEVADTAAQMPSNSPTFIERIFGIGN